MCKHLNLIFSYWQNSVWMHKVTVCQKGCHWIPQEYKKESIISLKEIKYCVTFFFVHEKSKKKYDEMLIRV